MQLVNCLSFEDVETIKNYIRLYAGVEETAPISHVLRVWNKQKRTLYKGLGHKLRVKIPVNIPRNTLYYQHELKAIYETYPIWDDLDSRQYLSRLDQMRETIHEDFVFEYFKFIAEQPWENLDKYQASRLLLHQNIEKGYISTVKCGNNGDEEYHFKAFKSTVKNNMRTVRTIQKVLKGMNFPYMDLFEKWRNKISDININKDIQADLVISIHPIDFMTMSDNNCDWSSCMSWMKDGSYSAGTIEMMNSNMAVIAYLESKTPFYIECEGRYFQIPNKSWRTLIYVHKDIIVTGKAYPYFNEGLSKCCLDEMRKLLKKNLNWEYKYINQLYRDNQSINNNFFLKEKGLSRFSRSKDRSQLKHAIYLYSNCMYNDLIEYKDRYWCCRNWVPKTIKLCISGPVTCMCCGDYIEDPQQIHSYDDVGSVKTCHYCKEEKCCDVCGKIRFSRMKYVYSKQYRRENVCSDECAKNLIWVPSVESFYPKDSLEQNLFFIIGNESGFKDSPYVLNFISRFGGWWQRDNNFSEIVLNDPYFIQKATIIKVPQWVYANSELYHTYTKFGWSRRPCVIGQVKFFDSNEYFTDAKIDIFSFIEEEKRWVPAEEVIDEVSRTVSS